MLSVGSSTAFAGAPMGLPVATLEEGQWSVSAEYAHDKSDMEASGRLCYAFADISWAQDFEIEDLTSNMFFAAASYGICDNWNLFVRLGAADATDDVVLVPAYSDYAETRGSLDAGYGLAWGIGTRATFCRWGPWTFGGQAQVTWFRPNDGDLVVPDPVILDDVWVGEAEIEYWQTQIGIAAVYQIDTCRLWGGPFLQFIEGDLDFKGAVEGESGGLTWRSDLEESSQFGAHAGVDWNMADQWNLYVEGQITGDSWLVGVGAVFVPNTFGL